ncbi:ParA family protein [Longirhabdus pacifica]|uniref:ParA family protein n=1 Tax=Longirhabdus pacifica TaxID=2305227 RepID=UPI0010092069|nr:ParA family protein [Longirhabdus pacifica]
MAVWAISTNKGGVLKTSITTNLAGVFSKKHKILIVDTDNQGNVALSFGKNPDDYEYTIYDVLVEDVKAEDAIFNVYKNIDVIPANDDMAFFEFDVLNNSNYKNPFSLLKNKILDLKDQYDYILIDTPPNMGLVQGNVLSCSDQVIIPFQPESYSMRSLLKILKAIEDFKNQHNPNLNILGVVATLVDLRTILHSEVLQECRKYCMNHDIKVFDTIIPRSVRFASSIAYDGLPASLTDHTNQLVASYYELAKEITNG